MTIITFVDNFEDEWEKWIACTCMRCDSVFDEDTENFDLDEEETLVSCPKCQHTAPLTLKTRSV